MDKKVYYTENDSKIYRVRRNIQKIAAKVFMQEFMTKLYYRIVMKKKLNLSDPITFNEKLQWYKLYYCPNNETIIKTSDKYTVREYVKECGCENYLNPLLCVYDNAKEINWNELPNKFALKCNHGCAYNIIVTDKNSLCQKKAIKILNRWMKDDFGLYNIEPHYDKIPKKIICEKYIETSTGNLPNDYKIYYFNGVPKLILVCSERASKLKLTFLDLNWNIMDIGSDEPDRTIIKPKMLDEAIEVGCKMAKGFPFVRVDFYDCDDQIIFGELSFTPAAAMATYYSDYGDKYLGNMFSLTMNKKEL